jgi:tRNA pseudouridine55 synthase
MPGGDGLLLINKPVGITSFDVIRRLRRITGVRKIGHTGTLDPAAQGLMLMLFGAACKSAQVYSKLDKEYEADIRLDASSSTGDREGIISEIPGRVLDTKAIDKALEGFEGVIKQVPPVYSAIKVKGVEAYKRVRKGEKVELAARTVRVNELVLLSYEHPILKVRAAVSSGTYIRSLAEDIGAALGTKAYLAGLVRSRVGRYTLADALELDGLSQSRVEEALLKY